MTGTSHIHNELTCILTGCFDRLDRLTDQGMERSGLSSAVIRGDRP